MAEESNTRGRIWRAIEGHRARALQQLDAAAAGALRDLFPRSRASVPEPIHDLARMLARDLTALGFVVHDSSMAVAAGGVWLAPCQDGPGVIVSWTQHDASAAVLGCKLHRDLQQIMNFDLHVVLRMLGYTVRRSGGGGANVVLAMN